MSFDLSKKARIAKYKPLVGVNGRTVLIAGQDIVKHCGTIRDSDVMDINVIGSSVAGDGDVTLYAGEAVNIVAGTSTLTEQHHKEVKESGFLSGGGFGFSYGTRTTTTDQARDATTQSGQLRSVVGSLAGNLNITAGEAIKSAAAISLPAGI